MLSNFAAYDPTLLNYWMQKKKVNILNYFCFCVVEKILDSLAGNGVASIKQ